MANGFSDSTLLKISAVGVGAFGLIFALFPYQSASTYGVAAMVPKYNAPMMHFLALAYLTLAGSSYISSTSTDTRHTKRLLYFHGMGWFAVALLQLYEAFVVRDFKTSTSIVSAAYESIVASMLLYGATKSRTQRVAKSE